MAITWAKMPTSWIRYDDKLRQFRVGDIGASIAALKIYLALVLQANYSSNEEFDEAGCIAVSYSQLEVLTDMSRALIARGIDKLKLLGLITVKKEGRPNIYRLTNFDDNSKGWGKVPKQYIYGTMRHGQMRKLAEFSMRHRAHLNALKVYLLIIAFRDRHSANTLISYDKITNYTGISREHIHPAISVLIDLQLISVSNDDEPSSKYRSPNKYHIRGL